MVGETLTASNGNWVGSPTSFGYQWLRCDGVGADCFPISGATGKTYGVQFADVYSTLRVRVAARNSAGVTAARSAAGDLVQPIQPVVTPGNKPPTIKFLSLRRLGLRVYARFTVCDDAPKSVTVIERDAKRATLAYVRKFRSYPTPARPQPAIGNQQHGSAPEAPSSSPCGPSTSPAPRAGSSTGHSSADQQPTKLRLGVESVEFSSRPQPEDPFDQRTRRQQPRGRVARGHRLSNRQEAASLNGPGCQTRSGI